METWKATLACGFAGFACVTFGQEFPKPYSPPCVERENVFAFTEKPAVRTIGQDRYEIAFAVKGNCDVAVGVIDGDGRVVRHLAAGVLGPNAPAPLQKNSLKQTLVWNGKDDLDEYCKTPDRLKVRVMLGLKPVFDRRLGGTSGHNLPAGVWGIAVAQDGGYVFAGAGGGFEHCTVRKFGHDGEYVSTVYPPPASMPEAKMAGTAYVEYEPGRKSWMGGDLGDSLSGIGGVLPGADGVSAPYHCQVAVAGQRLVYLNRGGHLNRGGKEVSKFFHIYMDGSTDLNSFVGRKYGWCQHPWPRLAASPDGKWIYGASLGETRDGRCTEPYVVRAPTDGSAAGTVFAGAKGKPGSDNEHLNSPIALDCDAQGRLYVSDLANNRIQVFSSEGKCLKSISIASPGLIRVHQKTGAIYVQHGARVEGRSVARVTKYVSFDNPVEEFHFDGIGSVHMALDSWSAKPRLWVGGEPKSYEPWSTTVSARHGVRIHEEDGKTFKMIRDFDAESEKEAGEGYVGRWAGDCHDKVVCDPVREQVYYRNAAVFDLKTGKHLGKFRPSLQCVFDDMAFDKQGYAHLHFNPCFFGQGVGRVDPDGVSAADRAAKSLRCPELPYDYGVEAFGWRGIIKTFDQGGAKGFQDGLGVNMRGDVASQCNIYYVPKLEDEVRQISLGGNEARLAAGVWSEEQNSYGAWVKGLEDARKRGEEVYSIRRTPGSPLWGGTIWTYNRNGETMKECAVIVGNLADGVQMDEDGGLYFVNNRVRLQNGKAFLAGKAGIFGKQGNANPSTGTAMKAGPAKPARLLFAGAPVPLESVPTRPGDLAATWGDPGGGVGWADGMEWFYAGASPVVPSVGGCSCPRQHLGLDWYKRALVPEAYRHSMAILDANGNLIMHVGQYGNFDDAPGGKDGARPGGTDIGMMSVRFVSATDNYLVYGDWGEKLVALKLAYHAEESVGVGGG